MTPGSSFSTRDYLRMPGSFLVIVDKDRTAPVELLKSAKNAGVKVAFSGGDAIHEVDEAQLKARLRAIRDAGLGWKDFWVPGKR